MALGKQVADSLETGEETGDIMTDLVVAQMPKLEEMEKEIRVTLKIAGHEISLLGMMDTAKKDLSEFKEYKTGLTAWTQKLVDNQGQITLYCTMIHALTGVIPKNVELVHAMTEKLPDGKFRLTGDIKRWPTERKLKDIIKMKVRLKKAYEGIGAMMEEELL